MVRGRNMETKMKGMILAVESAKIKIMYLYVKIYNLL